MNEENVTVTRIKRALKTIQNDVALAALQGINVKVPIDSGKKTVLHFAAAYGNAFIAEYLIKCGCIIDAKDENEITPLLLAVYFRHVAVVRVLIEAGADMCNVNSKGYSPIFYITKGDDPDLIKIMRQVMKSSKPLYRKKAEKLFMNAYNSVNFNHIRRHAGRKSFSIEYIVSNQNRHVALYKAAEINPIYFDNISDVLSMLFYYDVNVNDKTVGGSTPLHLAARYLNNQFITWLLNRGADINAKNDRGEIPLHFALAHADGRRITTGVGTTIELLLHSGSDIRAISAEDLFQLSKSSSTVAASEFIIRELALSESQGELLSLGIVRMLAMSRHLYDYYERCKMEFEIAQEFEILDDTMLFDLLSTRNMQALDVYVKNKNFREKFTNLKLRDNFPIVSQLLNKFIQYVEFTNLTYSAAIALNDILPFMDNAVIEQVIKYLSVDDLRLLLT